MKALKIYVDPNYPKRVIELLEQIHRLQKENRYQIINWTSIEEKSIDFKSSVFLLIDYSKKGLSVPTIKHFEEGYKIIAYKVGRTEKLDLFEFIMTIFRVWPSIIETSILNQKRFLYTFNYGGKRLSNFKHKEPYNDVKPHFTIN